MTIMENISPTPAPIIKPFSLKILAIKKLSKKEANVSITVVIGISMYSGVSIFIIINAPQHNKNNKVNIHIKGKKRQ